MARTVCVTGASGFLASWLVKRLLEHGYYVRGTVRDPDDSKKTLHLLQLPGAGERLQLCKADMTSPGVFDDIFEGCEAVFHVASSVMFDADDPQTEIVDAAVLGTLNVLNACKKSSTVKRVVYTSSASTLRFSSSVTPDTVLDESFWSSPDFCRQNKLWYPLSKTLAEQAAWEFAKSTKIDLVTIAPTFIIGYVLPPVPTASARDVLQLFRGDPDRFNTAFKLMGYVHLDDVVSAHIYVFENPNASGRYICSVLDATNAEVSAVMAAKFPEYNIPTKFDSFVRLYKGYSSKKLEELGFKFKYPSLEPMLEDFMQSMKSVGHL